MALTPEQHDIVAHDPRHHARVLAGPGTGKSFTSIAFLERLAKDHPDLKIRYITFTRAATTEFTESLDDPEFAALGGNRPSTVHGYALGLLLRRHSSKIPYPLRVPDSWESSKLVRPHISTLLRGRGFTSATPKAIDELEKEMAAGFEKLDPGAILRSEIEPELKQAYLGQWSQHRKQFGYVLLRELTYRAGEVAAELDDSPEPIDVIIVDEYQDLNRADIKFLQNLAAQGAKIIAVGDDDQSVYGWRMAAPDGIRNFLTEYADAKDYPLTVSRRCGGAALDIANALILKEPGRARKPALMADPKAPDTQIRYLKFRSSAAEAAGVAKLVAARIAGGVAPEKIVILARGSVSKWAAVLGPEFDKLGLPMMRAVNITEALGEPALRRIIALGHLAGNRQDSLAWWSLLKLSPGVGTVFINAILSVAEGATFGDKLLYAHANGMPKVSGSTQAQAVVDEAIQWLDAFDPESVGLPEGGWPIWAEAQAGAGLTTEGKALLEAVGGKLEPGGTLASFLSELEPLAKEVLTGGSGTVRVMTMAQSKGLTVDTAVVVGVEEGGIPSPKGEYSEEIRLLYVALTRAKQLSVMTWAAHRQGATSRVGRARRTSWEQRESSPLLEHVITAEDGQDFVDGLSGTAPAA